jgi:fermentation-respiration switch protein FrsA (DUF1100 family)
MDQHTFRPPAPAPSAEDVARAKLPPLPLLIIRFDQPDFDYHPALADAVDAARSRKADVGFEVLAPVPTAGEPTVQGQADAVDIATALQAIGVPPERIRLGLRADPGAPPREIRVYVR